MRLYNTWTSAQASLDIIIIPLEQREVVARNINNAETDDDMSYLTVKIVLSVFVHYGVERLGFGDVARREQWC